MRTDWEGQSSKTYLVWKRISELHAKRFHLEATPAQTG
jgi:hypothetical protein